jgi:hypothetical protein
MRAKGAVSMTESLAEYRDLWTKDIDKYVLVKLHPELEGTRGCSIFNRVDRMTWLIEDEEMRQAVMKRMAEAGVPIVGPEVLREKPAK